MRGAFAAGGLWLLAVVIATEPRAHHAGQPLRDIWGAIAALGDAAPSILPLVGVVAAAYLLGIVSEAVSGAVMRYLAMRTVAAQRWLAQRLPGLSAGAWWKGVRKAATVADFLETALGREYAACPLEAKAKTGTSRARGEAARERLREYVRDCRMLVHEEDDDLEAAVEESWADAEYRLQLMAPLLGLTAAVATYLPIRSAALTATAGFIAVLTVAASANHHAETANDRLAQWRTRHDGTGPPTSFDTPG